MKAAKGESQGPESGRFEPVNKTLEKSTACIGMWVVQARLFTLQMTLFLNSNLSYVEFLAHTGCFLLEDCQSMSV